MKMPSTNWKFRRRYLIAVTAFTMLLMAASLLYRPQFAVSDVVIEMGFFSLIGYVSAYVFGAVWEHVSSRNSRGRTGGEDDDQLND